MAMAVDHQSILYKNHTNAIKILHTIIQILHKCYKNGLKIPGPVNIIQILFICHIQILHKYFANTWQIPNIYLENTTQILDKYYTNT